ncbi:MAG: insulinase family protein [Pseudomonadota bacterium]|nr:MAG: insulinase family protein [Pseudomonadota bacterium]
MYIVLGLLVLIVVFALFKQRPAVVEQAPAGAGDNGVAVESWNTQNGATVLFVAARELPMVDVRVVFDAGSARDGDAPGLARLTNVMLSHGAGEWDTDTIAERFDKTGAQYSANALRDMAVVSVRTLVDPPLFDTAIATFAAILQQPRFPAGELDRERRRALVALQNVRQSPGDLAERAFYKAVFATHPYGSPVLGEQDTVKAIERDQLVEFHRRYFTASNAVIAIVGDVDAAAARALGETLAGGLPRGEPAPALPTVIRLNGAKEVRESHPSSQSHIMMGQTGMRRGDADYFALYVGNHILGGSGFGSRIVEEIREKRGLAYSSYSYFLPMRVDGPFIIGMQTRNDQVGEALGLLREILTKFVERGPDADELQRAKQNITGGFPLRLDSNRDIVEYVAMIGFYKLPLDYLATFNDHINAVTAEQIQSAFARRVNPDALVTVTVGDLAKAGLASPR